MTQQRHALTDAQGQRMVVHLPPVLGRRGRDDRMFIDAIVWIAKTGDPWRDLPARLGAWAQVYQRFARWSDRGHFNTLFLALQEPNHEQLMVDSTRRRGTARRSHDHRGQLTGPLTRQVSFAGSAIYGLYGYACAAPCRTRASASDRSPQAARPGA